MNQTTKLVIGLADAFIVAWLFFNLASSQFVGVGATDTTDAPVPTQRRSLASDWREILIVVCVSGIIYILRSLAGRKSSGNGFVWAWKKNERLRVLHPHNPKNQLKFRRYTSPIHLFVAVCVHYFVENFYFFVVVAFQFSCECSPTGKHSTYPGLFVAAGAKLILTAVEEYLLWRQEVQLNSTMYKQIRYDRAGKGSPALSRSLAVSTGSDDSLNWGGVASDIVEDIKSGEITRGKVVLVLDGGVVPVDGVILASSEKATTPILFNESGLTGETAPAAKFPVNIGADFASCPDLSDWAAVSRCIRDRLLGLDPSVTAEEPNASNVKFAGSLFKTGASEATEPIAKFGHKNAAYRGSKLYGTSWVLILAIYTGHDTKEGLAFIKETGVKDTPLDKQLGTLILNWNLPFIAFMSLAATIHAYWLTHSSDFLTIASIASLKALGLEWIVNFLFLNGLNNLSTRFFGDVVRIGQCYNMSLDSHMVIETNRSIPDSLGNVQVIISDKTGTITKNELKCEKLLIACGSGSSAVARDLPVGSFELRQLALSCNNKAADRQHDHKNVERFVTFMAVANGVMPKAGRYFSSNPDDLEFVNIAKSLDTELMDRYTSEDGHHFVRVRTRVEPHHHHSSSSASSDEELQYHDVTMRILHEHEFISSRKYMSIVLNAPATDGELRLSSSGELNSQVLLVLKGADAVVERRLSSNSPFKGRVQQLVSPFTREGKRVLVWAYKFVPRQEYDKWESTQPDIHDIASMETWWSNMETELEFAGCTVMSDTLQDGVEEVITYARECGIKVVMATGDSIDTAESIWRMLSQIQGPVHRLVFSDFARDDGSIDLERLNLTLGLFDELNVSDKPVLLLDSDMLAALKRDQRRRLAKSLDKFDSVVAARMTAAQKAEINRLYQSLGRTTLAIGDGANDITMIQEATVSVGLKSAETEAAARAADFKIQEFRNLQGLLVYGLQNYFRLSTVYLWNDYKAIVLALTPFVSRWLSNFKGESIIPGDLIFMLTTVVLSLPVVIFGIYDVPISVEQLVKEPKHYKVHRHKRFDIKKKTMWWLSALLHTSVILYTILTYWADQENALLVGVLTGQIIAVVTNMRLIFESRRGFHVADSWRMLIASLASMLLTVPISNLNPAFDAERRLKLGGTLDLPKLGMPHVQTVVVVAAVCLIIDLIIYALFGESHLLSWVQQSKKRTVLQPHGDDDDSDGETHHEKRD